MPHVPAVRIWPMSDKIPGFRRKSIARVQADCFRRDLPKAGGAFSYRSAGLHSPPGTLVLFQFQARIIASAVLLRDEKFKSPRADRRGRLHFDVSSIRTFGRTKGEQRGRESLCDSDCQMCDAPVMPRRSRVSTGGYAYHVLNRAVARERIFVNDDDYLAFERVLGEVHAKLPVRLLGYCVMPNHWHLVLWPGADGELSEFMRLLTVTHTQRWHARFHSAGTGPLYQGRFKSFPMQRDEHLLTVLRYVERNPVRAGLSEHAQDWQWSSLSTRHDGVRPDWLLPHAKWPVHRREDWTAWVNRPQTAKEADAVLACIKRGRPYGSDAWVARTAKSLSLQPTLRPRGRPRVRPEGQGEARRRKEKQ